MKQLITGETTIKSSSVEDTRCAFTDAWELGVNFDAKLVAHLEAVCAEVSKEEARAAAADLQDAWANAHEVDIFANTPSSFWAEAASPVARAAAWAAELAIDDKS